tara:strand:- start:234 stop:1064 length:831 start_codon:yes stop_codon:yes gene_type:complete
MAYIGSPQGTGFSTIRSQQFTGNGSLTAFTMRNSVSRPEHIEVFVNNVRQDPHSAYTVSGTTLTFTEAPGDATNNIYVVYLGGNVNTTEIPPDATIALRDGLKTAPSLFRNLEIATGMYFPKANTVAFAQGGKDILTGNNSIVTIGINGTTVATFNSTGIDITGSVSADNYLTTVNSVTVGAANVTLNFSNTNVFDLSLTTSTHLNRPSNIVAGQKGTIFVTQDGTGSRTLSYSSVFDFAGGSAPTLTTAGSAVDRIDYVVKSTSSIHAVATLALA